MPVVEAAGAQLYVRDEGAGPAILATHGFSETGDYWFAGGVAQRLAKRFRFVSLDMRGHGRTREPEQAAGYDVETLADDLDRVADALDLKSFVLLGHATGSVVAVRYATRAPARLGKLILTSAASATAMMAGGATENEAFFGKLARFYAASDWDRIMTAIKAKPWPFLHQLAKASDSDVLWARIEAVFRQNEPSRLAAFARGFYRDPDPVLQALARICVPTLVVDAEHDDLMRAAATLICESVPMCSRLDFAGVGHMTALECPERLAEAIERFVSV